MATVLFYSQFGESYIHPLPGIWSRRPLYTRVLSQHQLVSFLILAFITGAMRKTFFRPSGHVMVVFPFVYFTLQSEIILYALQILTE